MIRADIKKRAKALLSKNYGYILVVTIIMNITALFGGSSGFNFNFNFTLPGSSAADTETGNEVFDEIIAMFEEIFTNPVVVVIFVILSILATAASIALSIFVFNQLRVGGCRFFLRNRKNYPNDLKVIIASYKDKSFLNIAKVTFIRDLIISLGYVLFIVPGIIWTYQYYFVDYILAVRPLTSREEAFSLSRRLTDGHKLDIFVFGLSFLGWSLLSVFTCNILNILYVMPYIQLATTELYSDLRAEAIAKGTITEFELPDYEDFVPQQPVFTPIQQSFNSNINPQPTTEYTTESSESAAFTEAPKSSGAVEFKEEMESSEEINPTVSYDEYVTPEEPSIPIDTEKAINLPDEPIEDNSAE